MPWCPVCKNEYVDGIETCADCGCALADSLEAEDSAPLIFGERGLMEKITEYLQYNGFQSAAVSYSEAEDVYEVYVNKTEREKAYRAVGIFLEQESAAKEADDTETEALQEEAAQGMAAGGVYQASAQKAEDFKSSAYTLLIVGGLGIIVLVLYYTGIISLPFTGLNRYMVCGVMGALFILFLVMGVLSLKSSKQYASRAKTEDNLTKEILTWCREKLTREFIDAQLFEEGLDLPEEVKYFRRCEKMRILVKEKFMNLEEGYVEQLVDDYYQEVYDA